MRPRLYQLYGHVPQWGRMLRWLDPFGPLVSSYAVAPPKCAPFNHEIDLCENVGTLPASLDCC